MALYNKASVEEYGSNGQWGNGYKIREPILISLRILYRGSAYATASVGGRIIEPFLSVLR